MMLLCDRLLIAEFTGDLAEAVKGPRAAFRLGAAVSRLVKTLSANKEATIRCTQD